MKGNMRITYYAASSIDGFIARENGDVSWLDELAIDMADTGYDEFFAGIDGLVMGRSTYDFVFSYGSWPYGDRPTWVCTSRGLESLEGANLRVARSPDDVVEEAESMELNHLWMVGGGKLASSFLAEGLLSHLSISEMPVRLESGIPLFADEKLEDLSVEKTEIFPKKGFRQIEIALRTSKRA